ncbi:MAG: ROK family protein [Alphaproteobacteria bacterium]|nr:ROK family protein [Alphaproteobacteria bacterium]
MTLRFGIDLGGTKTEIAALRQNSSEIIYKRRISTERTYEGVIRSICSLVSTAEKELNETGTVGIGLPGALSPATGLIKNANSTWLNGKPFDKDLVQAMGRPIRLANDADCLALSEATDGAGADKDIVWGVILGTGVGSGIVVNGRLLQGANAICGEWGHNPQPGLNSEESGNLPCYCGRNGCIETVLSGPALAKEYLRITGQAKSTPEIIDDMIKGDRTAEKIFQIYEDRLARATAAVINILDPHVIVLGGGMSNVDRLYTTLPKLWPKYVFSDTVLTQLKKAVYGDSSGVRGAAWLWNK